MSDQGTGEGVRAFPTLREANVARNVEWAKGETLSPSWRGNGLAGAVGEVVEQIAHGRAIGIMDYLALYSELADVAICVDLVGADFGIEIISMPTTIHQGWTDTDRLVLAGCAVCNILKKIEREWRGFVGSRASLDDLKTALGHVQYEVELIALRYYTDLNGVVREKFNNTSKKYGLLTRIA